ncbi:MAG: DUF6134 family protein [Gammaproteobacteria bacterium]
MNGPNGAGRGLRALAATLIGSLVAVVSLAAPLTPGDEQREWQFRVLLDGKEIGFHSFELIEEEDRYRLKSEAEFKVRFLFFDAYSYRHVNEEIWDAKCLQRIDARTDVNGDSLAVQGEQVDDGFVIATDKEQTVLGECIMTFAYWNPEFLDQKRLLNSQTGEYVPVSIQPISEEQIEVRGQRVDAVRYALDAGKLDMQLWYTPDRQWLALESETKGGRMLRYELR